MPLFGEASSAYDDAVEKVTAETMTTENWALMMDISDRVSNEGVKGAKQCLLSIKKRLNHRDPHVVLFALSLLDCLWNNSTALFRREVSSNDFIHELSYRAAGSNRVVGEKTRELIKKWVDNECKKDASLSLIESLYKDLREEGFSFESSQPQTKGPKMYSNDPNVVFTEEEEADIAKAIALSLSEQTNSSYKRTNGASTGLNKKDIHKTPDSIVKQVKALYDFEAAEDNELSFVVSDLINVVDCSDQNWWRGQLVRSGASGLFPASFVTPNLDSINDSEPEVVTPQIVQEKKQVQIDEEVLKKCIELLEQCDPTGNVPDDPELAYYEQLSTAQVPLIDQKLAQIDKQHNMLANIDVAIRDVLARYDNAVQQAHFQMNQNMYGHQQPQSSFGVTSVPGIPIQSSPSNVQIPQQSSTAAWDPNATFQTPNSNSLTNISSVQPGLYTQQTGP